MFRSTHSYRPQGRDAQVPGARPSGRRHAVWWRLILVGARYGTCCMWRFWRLEFWGGFKFFGKFVDCCWGRCLQFRKLYCQGLHNFILWRAEGHIEMWFVQYAYNLNENSICVHPPFKRTHLLSPRVIIYPGRLKKCVLLLSELVVKPSQYFLDVLLSGVFVFVFSPLRCMHALSCLSQLLNYPAILMAKYSQWYYRLYRQVAAGLTHCC